MTRILIVDDHILIREGLKKILLAEKDMTVTGELGKGKKVREFLEVTKCDILILDVNLPDVNGLDVLKELRTAGSLCRVLMLSIFPEEHFALRAIRAGAWGYITKDSAPEELIRAIRTIMDGKRYITAKLAEQMVADIYPGSHAADHKQLSDREFEVLLSLGKGMSMREIAEELGLGQSTIHTYKNRILRKLDFKTTAQLIHYVISNHLLEED